MRSVVEDFSGRRQLIVGRKCGLPEIELLGRHCTHKSFLPLEEHVHPGMLEICYLSRGAQTFAIGHNEFRMQGGDLFFTLPDEKHGTFGRFIERSDLYWIILPWSSLGRILNRGKLEADAVRDRFSSISCRLCHGSVGIRSTLQTLFTEVQLAEYSMISRIKARARLTLFLMQTLEAYESAEQKSVIQSIEIKELLNWIEANLGEDLRISVLAARVHLSESRFKVRFRTEIGYSPADYVMRRRLSRAKELLIHSKQSVTKIALDLGFSSSQYFANVFRNCEGQTPSEFRKKQV